MEYLLNFDWLSWLTLIIKWFHVVAGIAWIGSSFYFIWLDCSLEPPKEQSAKDKGISGEVWSVHGGGFYQVAKYNNAPKKIPDTLHWFKWEAYTTWLSGFALVVLIYYLNSKLYLIDTAKFQLSPLQAILLSLSFIVGGWLIYDSLCKILLTRSKLFFGICAFLFLALLSYSLTNLFNSKAAFLHFGVVLGSIMAGNVFFVIIPNQKKIVASLIKGKLADANLGRIGKARSTHNNYLTLPVIFAMISGHFPLTFGHPFNWVVLLIITFLSGFFRHYFNLKHQGRRYLAVLISSLLLILLSIFLTDFSRQFMNKKNSTQQEEVSFEKVKVIIKKRCSSCHSDKPTFTGIISAPEGISYDNSQEIKNNIKEIYQRVVIAKTMPLGNVTQMTEEERQIINTWVLQEEKK